MTQMHQSIRTLGAALLLWISSIGLLSCRNQDEKSAGTFKPPMPPVETIRTFASKRVFFGHQSVGSNILAGLQALAPQFHAAGVPPPVIKEVSSAAEMTGPGVYHARIGRNGDPLSKIEEFEELILARGIGAAADVALLKFCYADLPDHLDPETLVKAYVASMERIKSALPQLTIIYVTMPLTSHTWSLKSRLRVLLRGDLANVRRNSFNESLLRQVPAGSPVLDIATIESTRPDGSIEQFSERGRTYRAMYRGYTYDNGHLNAEGASRVASVLIAGVAQR